MFVIWSHGTGFIMSHQLTFADSEFSSKRRQTRKEIFLSRMEQILPWQNMVEVIEPFYPKAGGRRPYPLETMLRSLHAALVQPERWRDGRCSVRNRLHASVCPVIPG
jgi:IS5 family transposase